MSGAPLSPAGPSANHRAYPPQQASPYRSAGVSNPSKPLRSALDMTFDHDYTVPVGNLQRCASLTRSPLKRSVQLRESFGQNCRGRHTLREYILNPVGEESPAVSKAKLAPRPASLKGKRIGLVDDRVTRSVGGIATVKAVVEERLGPAQVNIWVKPNTGRPSAPSVLDEVAQRSDVVILACCA